MDFALYQDKEPLNIAVRDLRADMEKGRPQLGKGIQRDYDKGTQEPMLGWRCTAFFQRMMCCAVARRLFWQNICGRSTEGAGIVSLISTLSSQEILGAR